MIDYWYVRMADKNTAAVSLPEETGVTRQYLFGLDIEAMYKAGMHFGHRISRLNPRMRPYIYGIKNTVHIIDLEKAAPRFEEALQFLKNEAAQKKIFLLVGTAAQHRELVKQIGEQCGISYVRDRWLGGTLTNFPTIYKRVQYMRELEEKLKSGEYEHYTKKERHDLTQKLNELKTKFEGVRDLNRLPDVVIVVDLKKDALAAKEARRKGIPTVGIADTNTDPTSVDYPIPGNDDATSSVQYIIGKIAEVIKQPLASQPSA